MKLNKKASMALTLAVITIGVLVLGALFSDSFKGFNAITGMASYSGNGDCGQTVTEDSVLTGDITGCVGSGLIIGENSITLDCQGHTISGSGSNQGISIGDRSSVTIKNCYLTGWQDGIRLGSSSPYANLINNTLNSNNVGIYIIGSLYTNLINNTLISNNMYGMVVENGGNTIYNNYFNNTRNLYFSMTVGSTWNTAKTSGTNIIGGPYLGGNFWATPTGNGFSQTCSDADHDRICDSTYNLATNNVDNLPLAPDKIPPATITNLRETTKGAEWVLWNWTNPTDADFAEAIVYINNIWIINTSNNHYNATGLDNGTSYIIKIHTKDGSGNVNTTDITDAAKTLGYYVVNETTLPAGIQLVLVDNSSYNLADIPTTGIVAALLKNTTNNVSIVEFEIDLGDANINLSDMLFGSDNSTQYGIAFIYINETLHLEISEQKVLYIPVVLGSGKIYVCPGAKSFADITPDCPGRYTISGLTSQGGYYKVNVIGTGGSEANATLLNMTYKNPADNSTILSAIINGTSNITVPLTELNVEIEDLNGTFKTYIPELNMSDYPLLTINAENLNEDVVANSTLNIGPNTSYRYVAKNAYAFSIEENLDKNFTIQMKYNASAVTNTSNLVVYKFDYNFTSADINYSQSSSFSGNDITIDTINENVIFSTDNFSIFLLTEEQKPFCGNSVCESGESCSSCTQDCGACPSTGGGGGGGGGATKKGTCSDGIINQDETGIDCGGVCTSCELKFCSNGALDLHIGEEGIDCGGICKPCPAALPSCYNNKKDGTETGIDCGGNCKPCIVPATCSDGIKNQDETGIDCGGVCGPCSVPVAATCSDGMQNQGEAGIDCGGPCTACPAVVEAPLINRGTLLAILSLAFLIGLGGVITLRRMYGGKAIPAEKAGEIIAPYEEAEEKPSIIISERQIKLLQKYIYHALAKGFKEEGIKASLKEKGWPAVIISDLFEKVRAIDKGIKEEKMHIPHSDVEKIEQAAKNLLNKGHSPEQIKTALIHKGWDEEFVNMIFEVHKEEFEKQMKYHKLHVPARQQEDVKNAVKKLIAKGYSQEYVRKAMITKGWNREQVDEIMKEL